MLDHHTLVALRLGLFELHAAGSRGRERKILESIVRTYAPKIDSAFRKAVRAATDKTSADMLLAALKSGKISEAISSIGWKEGAEPVIQTQLLDTFAAGFERSGVLHMRATKALVQSKRGEFTISSDSAVAYLKQHGADLVSNFGLANRDALKASLTSMLERGMTPHEMQKAIMPQVGLTKGWAEAVDRRLARLLAEGVSVSDATREASRYADELVRLRSLNIARSEALIAHGKADGEHRRQSIEQGLADADKASKTWNTAGDNVVRDEHAEAEGQTVGWDESFDIGGEEFDDAPAGVNCRCWVSFNPMGV